MKQLTCPLNGSRPLQEFHFGGEVRDMPNPAKCDDDAERDNMTDQILRTYAPGEDASA